MSAQLDYQNESRRSGENQPESTTEGIPTDSKKTLSRWRTISYTMKQQQIRTDNRVPRFMFDPDSAVLFYWVGAVSVATVYNAWMIALRMAFPEMRQSSGPGYLEYLDHFCDVTYLIDILIQLRTAYLQDGILVFDPGKIRQQYAGNPYFVHDLISVIPSGALVCYFIPDLFGISESLLQMGAVRLNRLFKVHVLYRFHDLAESRTSVPHFIRVFRLSLLLAIVIHWIACLYYFLSEYEGLGSSDWVYTSDPDQQIFLRKYIICMYWSAMTLTTIGSSTNPETDLEYVFTGTIFLTGVFVFATVLGNVGDVISSMNANRQEFQAKMDHIKMYLTDKKVPASLQLKIKKWAEYSWSRTKATDEWRLLNILPERLRAEVAVHVHLDNLKKVKIFEQCETGFLCELVLKLRCQVYSPGDYICKVGETGREMFIINHGKVEVVVPNPSTHEETVVAVLGEGNYFGEISLLRLDGVQNRRTADVRSIGYSELLCLSRKDLIAALVEYPEAKYVLEDHAKKRMQTSLQAKRAFSVDALLRNSTESAPGGHGSREDSRGKDVSEIKSMIEELKNINKVPGRSLWQLIARCELLQAKVQEKENEIEDSKRRIRELETLLTSKLSSQISKPQTKTITKQFSQMEGREPWKLSDSSSSSIDSLVNGNHSSHIPRSYGNSPQPYRTNETTKKRSQLNRTSSFCELDDLPTLNSCTLVNRLDKRSELKTNIRAITEEDDSGEKVSSLTGSTMEGLLTNYLRRTASCVDESLEKEIVQELEDHTLYPNDDDGEEYHGLSRRSSNCTVQSLSRRDSSESSGSQNDSTDSN